MKNSKSSPKGEEKVRRKVCGEAGGKVRGEADRKARREVCGRVRREECKQVCEEDSGKACREVCEEEPGEVFGQGGRAACGYAQGVDGIRIYYRIVGEGSPIMLFHGNGQDSLVFQRQIDDLSRRFQVIAVDSRGHGRSQIGDQSLSFSLLAQDAVRVLDHLDVDKTAVLGYSDGGNVALEMALLYPDRVSALILVSANLNPGGLVLPVRLWYKACYGFWTLLGKTGRRVGQVERKKQLSGLVARHPELTADMLSDLSVPVLVMAGQFDIIRRSHTREMTEAIPEGRLCILPGEQHRVLFQNWEKCDQIILDFLQTKTAGAK